MFPTFEADFNFASQVMKREVNTIGKKKIKMLKTKENMMNKLILIEEMIE